MKNIYVFGSVVRGEIDQYSDVDLLLVTDEKVEEIDPNKYSIYAPDRIKEMFIEGNPFAWHLYYESKLVYSSGIDFLKSLGEPSPYKNCMDDLIKFKKLFEDSLNSMKDNDYSIVFDLSMIFLAIRNFATCHTLGSYNHPIFSRNSFEKLNDFPLVLDGKIKEMLMLSRISSTRGINCYISKENLSLFEKEVENIEKWFNKILKSYESGI